VASSDYDGWAQAGNTGLELEGCVCPCYQVGETSLAAPAEFSWPSGGGGGRGDTAGCMALDWMMSPAAGEAGIPAMIDFNTGDNEGCSYFQVNQKRWRALELRPKSVSGTPAAQAGPILHRV